MESDNHSRILRFGPFEADLETGELRKDGVKLALQVQPFQVLAILLRNSGGLVTREQLQSQVWPKDTFVDFDHALNTAITKIRLALGDQADKPRFVETLPRRGYRFIAPVAKPSSPTSALDPPYGPIQGLTPKTRWIGGVTLFLALLSAVGIWRFARNRVEAGLAPLEVVPMAAMPGFESDPAFSPDGNQVAFAFGAEKDKCGIYTAMVDGDKPLRLTTVQAMLFLHGHQMGVGSPFIASPKAEPLFTPYRLSAAWSKECIQGFPALGRLVWIVSPAGGLSLDHHRWVRPRYPFFLPVKVLSRVLRGKFLATLKRLHRCNKLQCAGPAAALANHQQFAKLLRRLHHHDWVVYAKPAFGGPMQVLRYLGCYTHRVAISNHRLLAFDQERVTLRWKDYAHGGKQDQMTLATTEFLRRFFLHVPPRGFVRIRHFGFLANRFRTSRLALGRQLLASGGSTEQEVTSRDLRSENPSL
jgi:DNA-binding winged helix-turn-helix (wHTH) protein